MPEEDVTVAMDSAADVAEAALDGLDPGAVQTVATWFAAWYLAAGHKRLGRLLVARAPKRQE